ncbi:hypothetical protein RhiirA4_466465 [Rhizophagus irregularis]|uniref:Uncharacterized protein n=1 Tax=Rhizophagus irregularis TaxID=588596 RepID=A0A2I1GU29_9GLOM|nr:hypothetical protein RhiirA4_466465 [Rhizophagus irregularis]
MNLKILELDGSFQDMAWDHIGNLSLPYLQILKIDYVGHDEIINKRIVRAIYQNCPNLQYFNLMFRKSNIMNIMELEKLLIKCLFEWIIFIIDSDDTTNWDKLFEIFTK